MLLHLFLCRSVQLTNKGAHNAFVSHMAAKHPVKPHLVSALPHNSVFLAFSLHNVQCWQHSRCHVCLDRDPCAPAVAPAPALPPWQDRIRWDIRHAADTEVRTSPSPPTKPLRTHQPGISSPATADPAVLGIAPLHGHLQLQRALLLTVDPIWTPTEVPACSLHPGHANSL